MSPLANDICDCGILTDKSVITGRYRVTFHIIKETVLDQFLLEVMILLM